jgi:xanthosine utilization system XapX-like protein
MRPLGMVMHFGNGAALGVVYALIAHGRLPGPPIVRGLTFTTVETVGLYPLALLEGFHPGIKEGHLRSYLSKTAFAQQVLRHIAYGIVLGPLTERLLHRK